MLRTIFVLACTLTGGLYALGGPFNALLFYLWIAYFNPAAWVWDDFILSLNLSLIAGVIVVIVSTFSANTWKFNLRLGLVLAVVAQSFISTMMSEHFTFAWGYFTDFAKAGLITYFIGTLATDLVKFRKTLVVIALSLGFEAAKQGWVQLIIAPGAKNTNDSWMLGDNNGVAVGMVMLAPIMMALAATASGKWERRGYQFLAIGIVYRALTTYSRGGLLGCLAAGIWYLLRSKQKMVAIFSISIASLLILPVLPSEFWERMSTINAAREDIEGADASIRGRLHFWAVAVDMANDRPLVGTGHNTFTQAYDKYDFEKGAFGLGRSVHSAWFGILAELGYPGFLLFLALVVTSFGACLNARAAVKMGAPPALENYALAIEMSLVGFAVGGAFVPFQYVEILWHTFGLSAALALIVKNYEAEATVPAVAARQVRRPVPAFN
jgi:probable O-glycosylation ligase (exosortase A-associated)